MNAIVSVKKRPKKAIEERNVPTVKKKVKIAQPKVRNRSACGQTDQIVAQCGKQFVRIGVGAGDVEERDEDAGEAEPESTVRTEREGAKSISSCEFPHPSTELSETTIGKG